MDFDNDEMLMGGSPRASREWSSLQNAIYHEVETGTDNLEIDAVAGSGKTTTIVQALWHTPRRANVLFLAFNKHSADDIKPRVPGHVRVQTSHAFGLKALVSGLGRRPEVEAGRVTAIIDEIVPKYTKRAGIKPLVSLAKNGLVQSFEEMLALGLHHGLLEDDNAGRDIVKWSQDVLERCKDLSGKIDFDDMIWGPLLKGFDFDVYDIVLLDEAQDFNRSQLLLVEKAVGPKGRLIYVGDPYQSINAFRGADASSMAKLAKHFKAKKMPLSITYRCPKKVTALAQRIVPHIQAADTAPEGKVQDYGYREAVDKIQYGDMVISRTNGPLVTLYFDLLKIGRKATIRGRDIATGILKLVDRMDASSLKDLTRKLEDHLVEQSPILITKKKFSRLQQLEDQTDAIFEISLQVKDIPELKAKLQTIFSDDATGLGVVLSSIHRAKGLEAPVVWILGPGKMPLKSARVPWQREQEWNLIYVALTRTKSVLNIILKNDADDWSSWWRPVEDKPGVKDQVDEIIVMSQLGSSGRGNDELVRDLGLDEPREEPDDDDRPF